MTASKDPAPSVPHSGPVEAHLRLLATSDLHAHLLAYDYYSDRPSDTVGLARTATLIVAARAEAENTLLFDNGDLIQGSPLGDFVAQAPGPAGDAPHPVLAALNALSYDAATIGNHEFSHGLDLLVSALRSAAFPVVSCNAVLRTGPTPCDDATLLPPYVILDRVIRTADGGTRPIRVGVIGFLPPQVTLWDRPHLEGRLVTRPIVEAARAWLPHLKAAGADLVVALSHSGIGAEDAADSDENASAALAAIPGIDVVVAGHTHQVFPSAAFAGTTRIDPERGLIAGKPVVMPGFFGSHLGVVDLHLVHDEAGWRVRDATVEVRPIADRGGDGRPRALCADHPAVVAAAAQVHAEMLGWSRRSIGRTEAALHTFFALVTPSRAMRVIADAQARHLERLIAGTGHEGLPVLSAVAPFKAGGRGGVENYSFMPPGTLALRHAADLYIHPNAFTALRLSGAEIVEWLEHSCAQYQQVPPGSTDAPLIAPDFPSYNCEQILGLDYEIDLSQPARYDAKGRLVRPEARRIAAVRFRGRPLDPGAVFAVATNSYRAGGSGGFVDRGDTPRLFETRESNRDILLRHICGHAVIPEPPPGGWRFRPMPGTTVVIETSPLATGYIGEIAAFRPEPLGDTPAGFRRFRLHL